MKKGGSGQRGYPKEKPYSAKKSSSQPHAKRSAMAGPQAPKKRGRS